MSLSSCAPGIRQLGSLIACLGVFPASAVIIGTNPPPQRLTESRIDALPAEQRAVWNDYLARSAAARKADQAVLAQEIREHKLAGITIPPAGTRANRTLPLNRPSEWYAGKEAQRIADIVLSFQTPAGGWSKNLNMTTEPRRPGMHFAAENTSRFLAKDDFDLSSDVSWNYVGTFDNGGTTTQLEFLARVIAASKEDAERWQKAFLRGLDYIFAAQYPNGGWPQVWPLAGGYHDAVTYNDHAINNVLALLRSAASGSGSFAFVPVEHRERARRSFERGLECLLKTQVLVNGRRTAWAQQYDALTLVPTSARNYEMPSVAGAESANITLFLMELPDPGAGVIAAVNAAAAWFEKTRIHDIAYRTVGDAGPQRVAAPGAGPLWARYYEIGTDRPLFGDRDKTIHDDVNEISRERRMGYAWYVDSGVEVLERYSKWREKHGTTQEQ
jgi:PelA/Pel-15E family pectate lyase